MKPTRADIIAFIPRALAFVESQGGYADAELVDEKLGEKGDTREDAQKRPADEPAPTVDGKGRWQVGFPRRADDGAATADGYRARDFRNQDEPAFAVTEKARSAIVMRTNAQSNSAVRRVDEPAPTIKGETRTTRRSGPLTLNRRRRQ